MNDVDQQRWRLLAIILVLFGMTLIIAARLVDIQVLRHEYFAGLARDEHRRKEAVQPRRGNIFDRHGNLLATTVGYQWLYADPVQVRDAGQLATKLAPIINQPAIEIERKIQSAGERRVPVLLATKLPSAVVDRIRELDSDGLTLVPKYTRAHPNGDLAAQVLGVVGADNVGLSGLEAYFDDVLSGVPGWIIADRDTDGDEIAFGSRQYQPPVDGGDLYLTLDAYVQHVAERELEYTLNKHSARSGTIVVLEPTTGQVLALASRPAFSFDDPDLFNEDNLRLFRVPAIIDAYEPGSTFKVLTLASALDGQAVTPDTSFHNPGHFTYMGGTVKNAIARPPYEESMWLTLQRSSNIGAAFAATQLGSTKFYDYLTAFGLGRPTGLKLPGETGGLLRLPNRADWHPFDLVTNAFGQGISVTALQLTSSVAAVANGGTLMRPYLVQRIAKSDGETTTDPLPLTQVISAETAATLNTMLVSVVDYEEGGQRKPSRIDGYAVAGKTGTAEIPVSGGYSALTIASFVGYAPAEAPRFVMLVRIDEPKDTPWGETVAAPTFKRAASDLLLYFRIPPSRPGEIAQN